MADKKISYRIAIDGEAEYKTALRNLNAELKTLGTESKKLSAIYAGESNTYDALIAKSKNLADQQSALTEKLETLKGVLSKANTSLQEHKARTQELEAAQKKANDAYNNATEKTEELTKAVIEANLEYKRNQENIQYIERRIQTYTQQINTAEGELVLLNREIGKTDGYLQEAATSFDGTAHSIDKYGNEVKDAAEDTKSFANAADLLAQAIVASGAVEGAEKLRDAIVDTAKASIEYESAFAGVRKTVDGTAEELAAISDGIKGMATDIPIATKELSGIAEAAGQLGIETGNILKFTDVTAKLAATTDLSANDAAISISKLGNITKLTADEYSNFGSALVALGNNTSAFESEILAMAMRLASAGDIVGATNSQLLGIATTLVSVGIEAEAGGTAFSKLLRQIEVAVQTGSKKVQEYATVAGMSVEEFSSAWKNDAVGAVTAFIEGLSSLESKGQSSIVVLNEMGLTEQRLLDTISRLSEAEGMLSNNIALSNTAWEENTALANEAAIRFETTESKLQILNNTFNNLKITVGDELLDKFGGAINGLTDLTQAADEYVKKNPDVVAGITAVAAGLGSLAVAGTVIPLINTLWGLLAANPAGLAAASIMALVAGLTTYALTSQNASAETRRLNEETQRISEKTRELRDSVSELQMEYGNNAIALENQNTKLENAVKKIEELGKKTNLTAGENALLQNSIKTLNESIPGLNLNYSEMSGNIEDVVFNLRVLIEMQREYDSLESTTNALIDAEGMQSKLDASVQTTLSNLDTLKESLKDYQRLKDEFLEENGDTVSTQTGLTYEEMEWSPYDKDIASLKEQISVASDAYNNAAKLRRDNIERIEEYEQRINELDSNILTKAEEFKKAMEELNVESETTSQTAENVSNAAAIATEAAQTTSAAVKKTASSNKEAIDEAGKAIITHADTVKKNLETLSKEYDSAYKSAQSALGGIGGLFGEVAFKTDKSISDMLSGLDSQANYFTGYMLNLQRASQIGIDEGLVAALADGSDESAGYLQKIIDEFNKVVLEFGEGSPEAEAFVTDFNTKFEATSKAKDALAATMAGIQTNFEERAGDILAQADDLITELSGYSGNAYDEVSKAVSETLTDIADGFTKFQVAAQEKSQGIIDAANYIKTGINTTLEVLPEEMKVAGQNVSLGLSQGILDKAGVLEDTVRRLAKEAIIGAAKDELGIRSPAKEGEQIGKFFDEGIAQGIERNESTVISANLKMISDLESASQSAAAAAGTALGNTMAKSMAAALQAGQALRQQVERGELTVDGKVVQSAASVGIPSLTGQAALDWNAEQKRDFGLPDDWSNQDIVDWLNVGGFHGSTGASSSLGSAIEQAVKNESSMAQSLIHTTNKAWHDSYVNQLNANKSKSSGSSGGATVVVNQEIHSQFSEYELETFMEKGVTKALQKI